MSDKNSQVNETNDGYAIKLADFEMVEGNKVGAEFQNLWNFINSGHEAIGTFKEDDKKATDKLVAELSEQIKSAEVKTPELVGVPFPYAIEENLVGKVFIQFDELVNIEQGKKGNFFDGIPYHIVHHIISLESFREKVMSGDYKFHPSISKIENGNFGTLSNKDVEITEDALKTLFVQSMMQDEGLMARAMAEAGIQMPEGEPPKPTEGSDDGNEIPVDFGAKS